MPALLGNILWDLRKQMMVVEKLEEAPSGLFFASCDALGVEPGPHLRHARLGGVSASRCQERASQSVRRAR